MRRRRMSSRSSVARAETERDQIESSLTAPLRAIYHSTPNVLAAVFVDSEGECVDYCSGLDPFDSKVAAAQLQVVLDGVRHFAGRVSAGRPALLEILGQRRSFLVREVGDGYSVVVVVAGKSIDVAVGWALDECINTLRDETGLQTPAWDPECDLEVTTRHAVGWEYAPTSFKLHSRRHAIADVLGRWEEEGGLAGRPLVCFRVRDTEGVESTLAFDPSEDVWLLWEWHATTR